MLGGDHDRGGAARLAVHVFQRHLALGIGPEPRLGARVARLGERVQDAVGEVDGGGHVDFGLVAGEAEHDALVAGALVLVAAGVDALRDVGRLLVDVVLQRQALPVEALLLVPDLLDRVARHLLEQRGVDLGRAARFAGQDHAVGGRHRLDGDARARVVRQKGVHDGVRNAVANLVRMALGHRFAGEEIPAPTQSQILTGCSLGGPHPSWRRLLPRRRHLSRHVGPGMKKKRGRRAGRGACCSRSQKAVKPFVACPSCSPATAPTHPCPLPAAQAAQSSLSDDAPSALVISNRRLRTCGSLIL